MRRPFDGAAGNGVRTGLLAALFLLTAATDPGAALAADLTVLGCNERGAGEIGIRELVADIGDTVTVAVTIHTTSAIDAFGMDVAFPDTLLTYLGSTLVPPAAGDLTAPWSLFASSAPTAHAVRFGGYGPPLPSGSTGTLGLLRFLVTGAGVDSFSTGNYVDDIVGYTPCESAHAPTPVDTATWGRIKTRYR